METLTFAEIKAKQATDLPSFQINFLSFRSAIMQILSEWRASGFFYEYTDHSFNHVQDMLAAVDWIIPEKTKNEMTQADWFMLVISIYLHDIGLLVTKKEFDERLSNQDYLEFIRSDILSSDNKENYEAAIAGMEEIDRDRFLYQEYTRSNHGRRVKSWIEKGPFNNAPDSAQREVIQKLLLPLDSVIKKDLALLCESHVVSDIDDVSIYKVSQPYGGQSETVNLQYCAVILRTVDLIQITRKRAPSILYQIINPSNPLSQQEWLRHGAVRAVRPANARNKEGDVDKSVQSNTIEVHASFKDPDAFFALTGYLTYAQSEILYSYSAIKKSEKNVSACYEFPWRRLDSSSIETEGFLTNHFEFELDQYKILDLLTGHTLYNDATVVLRELTQNALDAVRLQCHLDGVNPSEKGTVEIKWDPNSKILVITDNGTGMSQEVIERHLLKVGSSRYQDPKFIEEHPDFHSISRFGIGVLSAFMVADNVEILTCNIEDEKARHITLRSVHGKYLIKLLDKDTDRHNLPVYPHGTSIKLSLRASSKFEDVLGIARSWLMFPGCKVSVSIGENDPTFIGYSSPKAALEDYLHNNTISGESSDIKVIESSVDGITVAFAVSKDTLFNDWGFYILDKNRHREEEEDRFIPVATCIEGIAVEDSTPGFITKNILAVANATGRGAPKTNVARSSLEDTSELRTMLSKIYGIYASHISKEIERLQEEKGQSLTRAVSAVPYLANPLVGSMNNSVKVKELTEAVANVPFIVVEEDDSRRNVSINMLSSYDLFWTVESPISRSVEFFLREAPSNITSSKLLKTVGNSAPHGEDGLKVFNLNSHSYLGESVNRIFDISEIHASEDDRQIRVKWVKKTSSPFWVSSSDTLDTISKSDSKFWSVVKRSRESYQHRTREIERIRIGLPSVTTSGLSNYGSAIYNRERFLLPGTALAKFLTSLSNESISERRVLASYLIIIEILYGYGFPRGLNSETLERFMDQVDVEGFRPYLKDMENFVLSYNETPHRSFNSFAWDKRTS